ncbi:MAG: hypothetical protein HeimC3_39310 [Candidatus Heimdallarchaeota archaeon LC_3]|nr:MAG: hypothetical protein HeimC3_39310 [Candidatus Heimdallarchaeota archaeon LC_3]
MNNNYQIRFGYSINGRSVSFKIESSEKIENFDKYAIMNDMISKEIQNNSENAETKIFGLNITSLKIKKYESQFKDWIKTLEQRLFLGLKPGILREELSDLLEETANIFLPKDKFELITDEIIDKDDQLYNYFEKLVYPLLQT